MQGLWILADHHPFRSLGRVLLPMLAASQVVRLRSGDLVTVGNLPGIWVAVRRDHDRRGWWEVSPKSSTPGIVALSSYGTLYARREDIIPLPPQEALL